MNIFYVCNIIKFEEKKSKKWHHFDSPVISPFSFAILWNSTDGIRSYEHWDQSHLPPIKLLFGGGALTIET